MVDMPLVGRFVDAKSGLSHYPPRDKNNAKSCQTKLARFQTFPVGALGLVRLLILHVYWSVLGGIGMDFDLLWI
jgi:hypothetical protein